MELTTLHDAVKAYLLADADVTGSPCSTRIYIDHWLPDGYQKEIGAALVLAPRGGPGTNIYMMENITFVLRSFAITIADAFAIDEAVFRSFLKTSNPASASSIYAKDTVSPTLNRESGGLYVVSSSYGISRIVS